MTDKAENGFTPFRGPVRKKSNLEKSGDICVTMREGKTMHLSTGLTKSFGINHMDMFIPLVDEQKKQIRLRRWTEEDGNIEGTLVAAIHGNRYYFSCSKLAKALKIPTKTHKLPVIIVAPEEGQVMIQFEYITED